MNRKAQEEMVGFVMIVVIVSVILVILLAIFIRQPANGEGDSRESYQFLESAMEYTSNCAVSYEPDYSRLGELMEQCYSGGKLCTSGKEPCNVLNETLRNMLEASFLVSEKSEIKGYEFKTEYIKNGTAPKEIIFIKKGSCSYNVRGSDIPLDAFGGVITSSLKLCF